jgi:ubiquinone/menaquinone biosynthesis C-methylase UbiE
MAGCGDGTEAILIGKHYGLKVTGIDSTLEGALHRVDSYTQIACDDLELLNFKNEWFSLAYCYFVL